jgi:transposase-like protein
MIDILPSELSKGIQLVGLEGAEGNWHPSMALLCLRRLDAGGPLELDCHWIESKPRGDLPAEAMQDLVLEGIQSRPQTPRRPDACPSCGKRISSGVFSYYGSPVCPEHVADLWTRNLLVNFQAKAMIHCPQCGDDTAIIWHGQGTSSCTACLVSRLDREEASRRWVLMSGIPLGQEALGDLQIFRGVRQRIEACTRCRSKQIRIRKIRVDFPKASPPLYPLWEVFDTDRTADVEKQRGRQLEIYTQGLLKVTLECPQCGYMDLEFPGFDLKPR